MRPNKFPARCSGLFLLRLVVAINNKTQQRERGALLQCLSEPPVSEPPATGTPLSRSHPPPAKRPRPEPRHRNAVPEPPATGTLDRYFVVGVHWRRNADARTPTKMSLSSAFFRWRSDDNKADDSTPTTDTLSRSTDTQQNFRRPTRNKIPLADEPPWHRQMLSALFLLRLVFVEQRRGATKRAQADKRILLVALYDPK
jgi:hypothetical protein